MSKLAHLIIEAKAVSEKLARTQLSRDAAMKEFQRQLELDKAYLRQHDDHLDNLSVAKNLPRALTLPTVRLTTLKNLAWVLIISWLLCARSSSISIPPDDNFVAPPKKTVEAVRDASTLGGSAVIKASDTQPQPQPIK